jgi:uncharacterized membrane protein YwzB
MYFEMYNVDIVEHFLYYWTAQFWHRISLTQNFWEKFSRPKCQLLIVYTDILLVYTMSIKFYGMLRPSLFLNLMYDWSKSYILTKQTKTVLQILSSVMLFRAVC